MTMILNDYKARVKRLRGAVLSVLNIECTQSQAYELMAKEDNYPNWDALSGSIDKNPKNGSTLANKEQITQLFLISAGISSGQTFKNILCFLAEQKNPILKKGWSSVKLSNDKTIMDALEQTNFFSDDVLALLKMVSYSYNIDHTIEKSFNAAIKYLTMGLDNNSYPSLAKYKEE